METVIDIPNSEYGEAITIEEYQGKWGLVASKRVGDDVYKRWCFPEFKKEPGKKSIPWKIVLGDKDAAVQVITELAEAFGMTVV